MHCHSRVGTHRLSSATIALKFLELIDLLDNGDGPIDTRYIRIGRLPLSIYLNFDSLLERWIGTGSGRVPSRVEKRNGAFFRWEKLTTNRPPARAAAGGMRHGPEYQEAGIAAGGGAALAGRPHPRTRAAGHRAGGARGARECLGRRPLPARGRAPRVSQRLEGAHPDWAHRPAGAHAAARDVVQGERRPGVDVGRRPTLPAPAP